VLQAAKRPNVLIIYADDLGFGDLQCYNPDSKIPTPNLDTLASAGMKFTDGHSSSGICTPSRYSILTGRYHWRKFHGIVQAFGKSAFSAERLTLPEMLKAKGYNTAAIGKWHLGWDWSAIRQEDAVFRVQDRTLEKKKPLKFYGPEAFDWDKAIPDGPLAHGFDYYFGDTVINFPPYCWIENDMVVKAPDTIMDTSKWKPIKEGRWECRPGPMCSNWDPYENIPETTRRGVAYIKQQAKTEEPFFLYFAYPAPHAPIIPNDQFEGKSKAGPYGDFVFETDDSIGQLLQALDDSDQRENTLIVFSADNGPEHYAYERSEKYDHWSSYPLRGLKRDTYDGGHRVPYIISWPGKVAKGSVSHELVSQIDVMATLASVVAYQLPADQAEDSYDLLPLITGKTEKSPRNVHIHNTSVGKYAIRSGDWTLIDSKTGYVSPKNSDWEEKYGYTRDDLKTGQLFNMKKDPSQKMNLIDKYPEKAAQLKDQINKIRQQGFSAPRIK
jgi:arylsulfatase A